jgi:hypothetical protein
MSWEHCKEIGEESAEQNGGLRAAVFRSASPFGRVSRRFAGRSGANCTAVGMSL